VKTMTYSESRAHYAETLNAVVDDQEEVVFTRSGHEPVVIVALAHTSRSRRPRTCCAARRTRGGCWPLPAALSTAAASSGTR
jgi:prevent-host-death family protein